MLSARSSWDLTANPLAALLAERRHRGARVIDLTLSNPTRAGLPPLTEAAALLASRAGAPYRPEPLGLPEARQAVCRYLADHGGTCDPGQVVLTASTSEAYSFLFKVLADPGDEVLVPRPSYPLFEYLAGLEGVRTASYPLRYDGARWALDLDRLAAALGPRSRALVLVSPNNPTGSFIRRNERAALVELARELDLALIVDEVFADYLLDGPAPDCAFAGPAEVLTFTLSGLSKVLALPQAKLSWMVVQGPPYERRQALDRLEVVADTFLSVGTAVQEALPELLACRRQAQAPVRERLEANLRRLRQRVGDGAEVLRCEAGWYAVLRIAADEERLALALLAEDGVLVHPGYFFDFLTEGHLVLSLLSPDFDEGVDLLCRRLENG
jgi:alanine-synthesizing transaminase